MCIRDRVYVDRLPPCNNQCPAGEDIQGWLFHAESGNYEKAWQHLTKDNPFPAIMGRVCYHSCESVCNRAKIDSAVGINSVERFLGDEAIKRKWKLSQTAAETGKHVLIVGAGPSGMSAAYHLRRFGPVSYTHLDVYKRQGRDRSGAQACRTPDAECSAVGGFCRAFRHHQA